MKYIYMNKTDSIAVSDRHIAICTMKGAVSELNEVTQRAEAAEARAAQLETENDEMQSYINEIRIALHTEKDELTIEAVRRVISERDELRAKLEQVQNWIESLNFIGIDSSKRYDYRSWIRSDQIGIKSEV